MTREQWAICYKTFNDAPDRPAWDVIGDFDDFHGRARGELHYVAHKHYKLIEETAKAGRLRLLDQHRAHSTKIEADTLISVEDARAYLAPLGFELRQVDALANEASAIEAAPAEGQQAPKLRAQEEAILETLKYLNFNPMALPPNTPGLPGVKAACKKALLKSPLFSGRTVFDRAWERMRGFSDIKYSE
jgi:hypothetical protein